MNYKIFYLLVYQGTEKEEAEEAIAINTGKFHNPSLFNCFDQIFLIILIFINS